jgi:hypothetical protein
LLDPPRPFYLFKNQKLPTYEKTRNGTTMHDRPIEVKCVESHANYNREAKARNQRKRRKEFQLKIRKRCNEGALQ